ncbi:N-6 DNA Methylase [delta proteobacterium NaphS2]|nr:N-6 DNA Methylase [delta proteobacterium NaphS2]
MLSPQLRHKVHDLWSLFWSSGLSNPLVAIEQITYLLFIRQLKALDRARVAGEKESIYHKGPDDPEDADFEKCRWSYIRQNPSFQLLNDTVFPWLRSLEDRIGSGQNGDTTLGRISGRLSDAYFILDVNKAETLKRAVSLIDDLFRQLDTRSVNSDIMGDIFEYLLEEVKESGKNGQFRTPRHVIRFMVQLLEPELGKTILDPACGSGGFLLNSLLHWKAANTDEGVLRLEWDGAPHDTFPVWPQGKQYNFSSFFRGYDNDRTMVRIAWMNLILHDLEAPEVHQLDSLSKRLSDDESGAYDYILANPPFTGNVDRDDLSENWQRFPRSGKGAVPLTTKSELLFVWLMLDLLINGGRAAVIVPDGVLFGSTKAHRELRRQLLFENTLEAVVSLPPNMFQPYSGVKTSILLFQKAGEPAARSQGLIREPVKSGSMRLPAKLFHLIRNGRRSTGRTTTSGMHWSNSRHGKAITRGKGKIEKERDLRIFVRRLFRKRIISPTTGRSAGVAWMMSSFKSFRINPATRVIPIRCMSCGRRISLSIPTTRKAPASMTIRSWPEFDRNSKKRSANWSKRPSNTSTVPLENRMRRRRLMPPRKTPRPLAPN